MSKAMIVMMDAAGIDVSLVRGVNGACAEVWLNSGAVMITSREQAAALVDAIARIGPEAWPSQERVDAPG